MNLHNYSLRENIETGILTDFSLTTTLLSFVAPKIFTDSLDSQAMAFANYIIEKSVAQFERKAKKESSIFGLFNSYSEGDITVDKSRSGYCIRTGKPIPFNPKRPMCNEAYDAWAQYKRPDYKEKFCHKTVKPSAGQTSMRNPVLS